ncbi:hypothetical protein ABZ616_14040 [Streptomyces noursei]|uniref:Uncharacterized protein n=1 Tax=Streptomyces mashuensis TaxID=33904 RepID=A0A919EF08_9ACTN|nr:hypothetical protein [Streptomyces mashuensis]GHF61506.1 hypothetical protein GCM10010218_48810 [Streptomyces mashuensis]
MAKTDEAALWERLAELLNTLDGAGLNVHFGDRMGPETDWYTAPYVYAGNRGGGTRVAWDRKRRRWTVEQR